jgi:hypothetical protein
MVAHRRRLHAKRRGDLVVALPNDRFPQHFRFPLRQIREAGSELGCGIANRKGRRIVTRIEAACDPAYELFGKLVATHVGGEDQDGANGSVRCGEHNRAQPHPDRTVLFRTDASPDGGTL